MKTHWHIALAALLLITSAKAGTFLLVDQAHVKMYGPFEYKDKTPLQIGDSSMILKIVSRDETAAERLAKTIIIPSLEFRNAALKDVIDYLREASVASGVEVGNVNLIWNVKKSNKVITLNLRKVSLADSLRYVTEVSQLDLRWDENAAVISDKTEEVQPPPAPRTRSPERRGEP